MTPRIEVIKEKKLVGKKLIMSYADYKIGELWGSFMQRRKEIVNPVSNDLISMVIYKPDHFTDFKPTNKFERWAAVEVEEFENVPGEMERFVLASGLYAIFHYTGSSTSVSNFFQNIFSVWLPESGFVIDDRPHFEVLGDKYRNNDPLSEEDIWIPVRPK